MPVKRGGGDIDDILRVSFHLTGEQHRVYSGGGVEGGSTGVGALIYFGIFLNEFWFCDGAKWLRRMWGGRKGMR